MKRKLLVGSFALFFLLSNSLASAHPGRTDSNGGHRCWTNCSKWGLEYGEYHYHNGGGSSSSSSSSSKSSSKSSAKKVTPKSTKPAYKKSNLGVFVNGERVFFIYDPVIYQNTNLVPLREIAEELGASFTYEESTGVISVTKGNNKVTLVIDNKKVYYNGKSEIANVAPKIIEGVTYVPVQVLVKGLGASIKADSSNNTISITIK